MFSVEIKCIENNATLFSIIATISINLNFYTRTLLDVLKTFAVIVVKFTQCPSLFRIDEAETTDARPHHVISR